MERVVRRGERRRAGPHRGRDRRSRPTERAARVCVGLAEPSAPGFLAHWTTPLRRRATTSATRTGPTGSKGGADSPENFLGYAGFDDIGEPARRRGTRAGLTDGLHEYAPHIADWNRGRDPGLGRRSGVAGVIGALNYLASEGVNSIYFLPCNLEGDGSRDAPVPRAERPDAHRRLGGCTNGRSCSTTPSVRVSRFHFVALRDRERKREPARRRQPRTAASPVLP